MHEASVAFEIYQIVEESIKIHNLKNVDKVSIKVGDFNGIDENALRFAFNALTKESKYKNTKLIIEKVQGFELLVERIEGE